MGLQEQSVDARERSKRIQANVVYEWCPCCISFANDDSQSTSYSSFGSIQEVSGLGKDRYLHNRYIQCWSYCTGISGRWNANVHSQFAGSTLLLLHSVAVAL